MSDIRVSAGSGDIAQRAGRSPSAYSPAVAKGAQVRRALGKRFEKLRQHGSHAVYRVGPGVTATFAYHDRAELADRQLRQVAADFGLTLEELKKLL
jgi:predicted RNA binding protein YcfA (HicA-like mRNA interferase family)